MSRASIRNTTFSAKRVNYSQDAIGGQVHTKQRVISDQDCRLWQLSEAEQEITGKEGLKGTHRLQCSSDLELAETMEVTADGKTFDIGRINDFGGQGAAQEVTLVLRT